MTLETTLVNCFIRRYYLTRMEIPLIEKLKIPPGQTILEVGCGKGMTSKEIYKTLKPKSMTAIDLHYFTVNTVKRRITFLRANAEQLPFTINCFDLVIELCCLHHVSNWRKALTESMRVLKPGGLFVFEDFGRVALEKWHYRYFDHPKEDRFTEEEFLACVGGVILHRTWFGDAFFGIARKEI